MSKVRISMERMGTKGHLVECKYPECIINEMIPKFSFKENYDHDIEVVRTNEFECEWIEKKVVLRTYIDFAKFVCDFVKNELPRPIQCMCWDYRIGDVIDKIPCLTKSFKYGKCTSRFKPGIFVNGKPVKSFDELKEIIGENCWEF